MASATFLFEVSIMGWVASFAKSSIGAKVVMGTTGLLLVGFIFAHMAGNLLVFAGQDALNAYAANLKDMGALLWVARGGLLALAALHIASAIRLTQLNRAARPERYRRPATIQTGLSARTMALSGLLLLSFIVFHLLHFTFGATHPEHFSQIDSLGRHDVYSMVIAGFREPAVAISYAVAMVLLALHLNHGVSSMFQSLGLRTPRYRSVIDKLGPTLAVIVFLGNTSMPVAVLTGLVGPVGA